MANYCVTIDRGSVCYEVKAESEEAAEQKAAKKFIEEYGSPDYDWWVAETEEAIE